MAEPEAIADHLEEYLSSTLPLFGKKVLINAGPTHEHLDPVRFLEIIAPVKWERQLQLLQEIWVQMFI